VLPPDQPLSEAGPDNNGGTPSAAWLNTVKHDLQGMISVQARAFGLGSLPPRPVTLRDPVSDGLLIGLLGVAADAAATRSFTELDKAIADRALAQRLMRCWPTPWTEKPDPLPLPNHGLHGPAPQRMVFVREGTPAFDAWKTRWHAINGNHPLFLSNQLDRATGLRTRGILRETLFPPHPEGR